MSIVALRVLLAPALVALSTFAAHRWGETVGGWLVGLPLVSGPVSVLLFMEYGPRFARDAARGTLLGLVAAAVFYACYAFVAVRQPWWRSLAAAFAACVVTGAALTEMGPDLTWSIALALVVLGVLASRLGAPSHAAPRRAPAVSRIVARMAIAGLMVWFVTSIAGALGPTLAGVLAPLPIAAAVLATSAHRHGKREMAGNLLRGTLAGSWGGVAFFAVVGLLVGTIGPVATYLVATGVALTGAAIAGHASRRDSAASHQSRFGRDRAGNSSARTSTDFARIAYRSMMWVA